MKQLLTPEVNHKGTKFPNILKSPGHVLPAKAEDECGTAPRSRAVPLAKHHLPCTEPKGKRKPCVWASEPVFSLGRDTTTGLQCTAYICNKYKTATVISQVLRLKEKNPALYTNQTERPSWQHSPPPKPKLGAELCSFEPDKSTNFHRSVIIWKLACNYKLMTDFWRQYTAKRAKVTVLFSFPYSL